MGGCACRQHHCILCEATLNANGIAARQVCDIRGMVTRQVFRPRELLFQQGMPVRDLYVLRYGYVKLNASLPDGRSQGLQLGMPWGLIGMEALDEETYPCTAEAATDVQVCTIRRDDFLQVMGGSSATSWKFITMLNRQLRRSMSQARNLGLMDATERVASFLSSMTEVSQSVDEEIPLPLTRGDIGQVLGLTVETVSRVLTRLKKEGIVDVPSVGRHFRVLDWQRLAVLGGDARAPARDCA